MQWGDEGRMWGAKWGTVCPLPAPLPYLCPCPGLLLQPWHPMQPCSRSSFQAPADPSCSPLLPSSTSRHQAGHSPVPLGGDAAADAPKAVGRWVDWHRDEGNTGHWLALRAGWVLWGHNVTVPRACRGMASHPELRVQATVCPGCPPCLQEQGSKVSQELPLRGHMVQSAASSQGTLAVGSGTRFYPLLHPLQLASSRSGPQSSWGEERPSTCHPVLLLLQQLPGL